MSKIDVGGFFEAIKDMHEGGGATEHSYRPALQSLLQSINPALRVINEPRRVACGSPDFVIMRDDVPVGYLEAKDIKVDIRPQKGPNKNQQDRYRDGLANLIYTNGTDWDFYRHDADGTSVRIGHVKIADFLDGFGLQAQKTQFAALENRLYDFASQEKQTQTITSSTRLAKIMAGKARLIRDALAQLLVLDEDNTSELGGQYSAFKKALIHDVTKAGFADIYAETIVYGMFAARYHDPTPEDFSRQEALELLPKSNPFLRKLFSFIATNDLDADVRWIIDELARVFQATNVHNIMGRWSDANDKRDPFLHFYETFLAEYNPAKRKSRGVWYTPEAVVNFIVRAVDDVLKTEFNLPLGLADTSKISVNVDTGLTKEVGKKGAKKRVPVIEKKQVHRVQILDPATGTGTFLAEVIKQITPRIQAVNKGGWSKYVEDDLIPRLHGFELLMASYAMCHMKLDMMLTETGYTPTKTNPPRLSVYLTNSLEEGERIEADLFPMTRWLSDEAAGASEIKRDKPIMCIIGNPPYSGESANKGQWIMELMEAYKKEPGGKEKLKERNPKWINKDEHKFIRLAEHMISENGEGVLGFITSHGYLSDPTLRGMRWHLLTTFDQIYIVDLHGNANKKEKTPEGNDDKNVFDIMQGVSIFIGIKKNNEGKNKLAKVKHIDLWGKRQEKYDFLTSKNINVAHWITTDTRSPKHLLEPFDYSLANKYQNLFGISDLFSVNGRPAPGFVTTHDEFAVSWDYDLAVEKVETLINSDNEDNARKNFRLCSQKQWNYENAKKYLSQSNWKADIETFLYRPFDKRVTVFNPHVAVHKRERMTQHFLRGTNIGLITSRMAKGENFAHVLATDIMTEAIVLSSKTSNNGFNFPLYLYPEADALDQTRRVNMDPKIRGAIENAAMGATLRDATPVRGTGAAPQGEESVEDADSADSRPTVPGLEPGSMASIDPGSRPGTVNEESVTVNEEPGTVQGSMNKESEAISTEQGTQQGGRRKPDEVEIFDYIYGVLHCPAYRETYAEFLKIDFPRVPYPSSPQRFWDISAKGRELRLLHLMDGVDAGTAYPFKGEGDNHIETINAKSFKMRDDDTGNVFINAGQYFEGVPKTAWEFYIGGYQPAQKWLKDRKGRELSFEDIMHYRKIIHILMETDRIMKTIEMDL